MYCCLVGKSECNIWKKKKAKMRQGKRQKLLSFEEKLSLKQRNKLLDYTIDGDGYHICII